MSFPKKHYFRIDEVTQEALEELTRITCLTKSELVRNFVRQGVQKELSESHRQIEELRSQTNLLKHLSY